MSFVIRDVRIFTGEEIIESGSVLVQDGLIKEVGVDVNSTDAPSISCPGHTLLPGLIDAHCHPYGDIKLLEQALRFGITTSMDMHNMPWEANKLKKICAERKDVADLKSSGHAATIHNGWPSWITKRIDNPELRGTYDQWPSLVTVADAEAFIEQSIREGSDYIKMMNEGGEALGLKAEGIVQLSADVKAAVCAAARKRGLIVVAHAFSREDTLAVLEAGVHGLAHTFYDKPMTPEVIAAYKKNSAWCNPTLAGIGSLTGEGKDVQAMFANDERAEDIIDQPKKTLLCACMHMKSPDAQWEYAFDGIRQLKAAGVDIICGSDTAAGAPGLGFGITLHEELYLFVTKVGFSPLEALRATTSLTARKFGWADRGWVAPGYKADLLVVDGNPFEDIRNTLNIRDVWRDGVRTSFKTP